MKVSSVMILLAGVAATLGAAAWYITADGSGEEGAGIITRTRISEKTTPVDHTSKRLAQSGGTLSQEARDHYTSVLSAAYTQSRYGRMKLIVEFLGAMTADNWREMLEIAVNARMGGLISAEESEWCSERAGEVGGLSAVEAVRGMRKGDSYMGTVCGWARADPSAAWAYIEAAPSGRTRNLMTWGFVKGAAVADVNGALRAFGQLPTQMQAEIAAELASSSDARGYEQFLRKWLAGNGKVPVQEKSNVLGKLMLRCAIAGPDSDGSKLMRWLEPFAGSPYAAADNLSWLGESLSGQGHDLSTTTEWLSTFSHSAPETARKTFRKIFEDTPDSTAAAIQWLQRNRQHPCYDDAVIGFLSNSQNAEKLDFRSFDAWAGTLSSTEAKTIAELLRNKRS